MQQTWAVLALRDTTDTLPVQEVEQDLLRRWPEAHLKFPAIKQGQLDRDNPLSQYVFVAAPTFSPQLEKSQYAARVLRDPLTHQIQHVTDEELAAMTPLPELPPTGSTVRITAGDWAGMDGVIVETNCKSAKILIELWSRQKILTLTANEFAPV